MLSQNLLNSRRVQVAGINGNKRAALLDSRAIVVRFMLVVARASQSRSHKTRRAAHDCARHSATADSTQSRRKQGARRDEWADAGNKRCRDTKQRAYAHTRHRAFGHVAASIVVGRSACSCPCAASILTGNDREMCFAHSLRADGIYSGLSLGTGVK